MPELLKQKIKRWQESSYNDGYNDDDYINKRKLYRTPKTWAQSSAMNFLSTELHSKKLKLRGQK